jgi:ribosome-associated heat shock protein Hsp15
MESTRVDRWLWATRLFKTRSEATAACKAGHVRVNDTPAKPAAVVRVGDRLAVRAHGRDRDLEVVAIIDKRVGAPLAQACLVDHTPPPAAVPEDAQFVRDRGSGRPTKRDRRDLDRLRSR